MVGNIPNYSELDILRALLSIDKPISRLELVNKLELGEGTIRTILDILKNKKLIDSTKKGHFLSEKGKKSFKKIKKYIALIKKVKSNKIYPEYKKIGLLLKNVKNKKIDYKLRDIAVKNNADGAILFVYKNGLKLPDVSYKMDAKELEKQFALSNGDILIITFAEDYKDAENGALAVAVELSKKAIQTTKILN